MPEDQVNPQINQNNLFPLIMERLNIDINEKFQIKYKDSNVVLEGVVCKFTDSDLLISVKNTWLPVVQVFLIYLTYLLNGTFEIVKLPYKPKVGQRFYTYRGEDWIIENYEWADTAYDKILFSAGCVFKTAKEAAEAFPEIYKKITGEKHDAG